MKKYYTFYGEAELITIAITNNIKVETGLYKGAYDIKKAGEFLETQHVERKKAYFEEIKQFNLPDDLEQLIFSYIGGVTYTYSAWPEHIVPWNFHLPSN